MISRDELTRVLRRPISYCDALTSTTREDDLRMLAHLQPTFLGRLSFPWEPTAWTAPEDAGRSGPEFEETQFTRARALAEQVHALLPDAVCQGVVWEGVYPSVSEIPVPRWAFEDLRQVASERNFDYEAMFGDEFERLYRWDQFGLGCQVFDLTFPESELWLYYRACRLIDAGYEAIHMGQPHLYAARDEGYARLDRLFTRIRRYAVDHARRGFVLLDAHTHGIVRDGRLLFDLHARPISARAWIDAPEKLYLHLKGPSLGGITPAGWECDSLPFLVEIDNWGGYSLEPSEFDDPSKRVSAGRWGWDDISWFAHQSDEDRRAFLEYAHRWTEAIHPDAFFQMPVRRTLDRAAMEMKGYGGTAGKIDKYHANTASEDAPFGFGDEDSIARIWESDEAPSWSGEWIDAQRRQLQSEQLQGAPVGSGAARSDPPVVLVGSLQRQLGGIPGESFDPFSRMVSVGNGTYLLAMVIQDPGEWEFSISVGGTMTDVTRHSGLAGGRPFRIVTSEPNEQLLLRFTYRTRSVEVLDAAREVLPV